MLDGFDKVEVLYEFKETLMPEDSHQTQQIFRRCFRFIRSFKSSFQLTTVKDYRLVLLSTNCLHLYSITSEDVDPQLMTSTAFETSIHFQLGTSSDFWEIQLNHLNILLGLDWIIIFMIILRLNSLSEQGHAQNQKPLTWAIAYPHGDAPRWSRRRS